MAERDRVGWSQLPDDLLSLIAKKHLNTRIHNLRLRSVCWSWRSSIPPFTKPPPLLPVLLPFPISGFRYFTLTENTIYLLQPPNENPKPNRTSEPFHYSISWFIRVEEMGNGKMRALNPLSQIPVYAKIFPKMLNLLDFRITEIGKGYKAYGLRSIDLPAEPMFTTLVVVSSSPWSSAIDDGEDYAVMTIHKRKLRFLKLGDAKLTTIDISNNYDDCVYHKGQFYAIGSKGKTVVIGSDLKAKPIAWLGRTCGGGGLRLVKSGGDLFLIDKHFGKKENFDDDDDDNDEYGGDEFVCWKVFKLNETEEKWERVESLGDRVLFACDGYSYSVSARDFAGLRGDCIYLSGSEYNGEYLYMEGDEWWADTRVFSLVDRRCGSLPYIPGHSQIFWPPPPWLYPTSRAMKK